MSSTGSTAAVDLRVVKVIEETADARSIVLAVPPEEEHRFGYAPGQFLTVRIPSTERGAVARSYSLSSAPGIDPVLKVTVKRTQGGYGSNWLCDNIRAGDVLTALPPSGRFTPERLDEDLLLFAAGSGITPVVSIMKTALARGEGRIALVYANTDASSVIFEGEIARLETVHPDRLTVHHWLDSEHGWPTPARVAEVVRGWEDSQVFLCGPGPFMNVVTDGLTAADVPRARIHREIFSSLSGDPFVIEPWAGNGTPDAAEQSDGAAATVRIAGETLCFRWPRHRNLVEVLLEHGVDVPYSCRSGECGSCACTVVSGEVAMEKSDVLDAEDIASGYVLGCQARPTSDAVEIDF